MVCPICGNEVKKDRRNKYCSEKCQKINRKEYQKMYHKEYHIKSKDEKFKCMMCGEMKCKSKYEICKQCKNTDTYQDYDYCVPCAIHS